MLILTVDLIAKSLGLIVYLFALKLTFYLFEPSLEILTNDSDFRPLYADGDKIRSKGSRH